MKFPLLPLLFGALTLGIAHPLPAAQRVSSYAEARRCMQADGLIVFACADGWDAFSQQRCERLMKDPAILRATKKAVLMLLPIPEQPSEARRQEQKHICGELNVPGASSYPALFLFDNEGRHYATLCGSEVSRGEPSSLATLLTQRIAGGRERARLLNEAEKSSGPEKARLLFQSCQIEGITSPWPWREMNNRLAEADPGDVSGTRRSWNFNAYDFAGKLNGMELSAALAEAEKALADTAFTPRQKQMICAAALGVLRRKGNAEQAAAFHRYAQLLENYAPQTPEGQSAAYVRREWAPGLRYGRGWSPSSIPLGSTPAEMEGPLPIHKAGDYAVTFSYTHGQWALVIRAVELYDGDTKVAEDRHNGSAGHVSHDNVYTLRVRRPVAHPRLFITTDMKERDSAGSITIKRL